MRLLIVAPCLIGAYLIGYLTCYRMTPAPEPKIVPKIVLLPAPIPTNSIVLERAKVSTLIDMFNNQKNAISNLVEGLKLSNDGWESCIKTNQHLRVELAILNEVNDNNRYINIIYGDAIDSLKADLNKLSNDYGDLWIVKEEYVRQLNKLQEKK